jgi:tetratricopeptide (TPR) repeat protein
VDYTGLSQASSIDNLYTSTANSLAQLDGIANSALSRGLDRFISKDYKGAVKEFKLSLAVSPYSDNSDKAYDYLAQSYLKLNNTKEAEKTYKQMIQRDATNDSARLHLGNLYFKAGNYKDAETQYFRAVQVNPSSADNRYALGQVYMKTGRYAEAENQLRRVVQISPKDPYAHEALGQSLRSQQKYTEAETQFEKAVTLDKKFTDGYLDLGYLYTDMKLTNKAKEQHDILNELDKDTAITLQAYMDKAADPKLKSVYNTDTFPLSSGRNTLISTIDEDLLEPEGSKDFTLNFMFDKEMAPSSIQNIANWQISRATSKTPGGPYNLGLPLSDTEVLLPSNPAYVTYDKSSHVAQVTFRINQNDLADATLDPAHIVFKFLGKDAYGNSMDSSADEYSYISKIV